MNGITYFRKKSSYPGDVTKNCSLTGAEMDENFYTLEGRDIKSVTVDGDDIVITLLNGEQVAAVNALNGRVRDVNASFDVTKGVLTLEVDGMKQEIDGFSTEYTSSGLVATDGTVVGNGKSYNPIGVAPTAKTGAYRPVNSFIDMTKNQRLPKCEHIMPGDRFLTCENESDYGYLYNYEGVSRIATALYEANSPWRIPSKEDWDEMLNAIEPCDDFKNHDSAVCNKHLGRFAGAFLKSTNKWRGIGDHCHHHPHPCDEPIDSEYFAPDDKPATCDHMYCGEHHHRPECHPHHPHVDGLDKYGMNIMPAGYVDDGDSSNYFGERAWYWASTPCNNGRSVYTKRFEHDKASVYQDITPTTFSLSLRLVKDYDGNNYNPKEDILGQSYPTVLMPSVKRGSSIWTSINVTFGNRAFNPILPNNGTNLTMTKKFYINEWTGNQWMRNEVRDGESVVIKRAPNGNRNIEYRVVGEELHNVADFTFNDVMENINPQLEALDHRINIESATARENEQKIKAALNDEIARSTDADAVHDTRLDALEANGTIAVERLDVIDNRLNDIDSNLEGLHAQVDNIAEDLANTKQTLVEETAARTEADTAINERCSAIEAQHAADTQAAAEKIAEIETNLAKEASARENADDELNQRCDAIAADLVAKAEELQNNIDDVDEKVDALAEKVDENQASEKADVEAINQRIDEVEATVPVEDGSSYDEATGNLFLKSKGGTNDITVQLSFNFGTI